MCRTGDTTLIKLFQHHCLSLHSQELQTQQHPIPAHQEVQQSKCPLFPLLFPFHLTPSLHSLKPCLCHAVHEVRDAVQKTYIFSVEL